MKFRDYKAAAFLIVLLLGCGTASAQQTSKGTHTHRREVDDPNALLVQQAEAAIEKKDYVTAEPLLKKVVADNPKDYRAWFNLGYLYSETNRVPDAIDAYHRSVAAQPNVLESNLNLAVLLAQTGDAEAGRFLRAAAKLKPTPAAQKIILKSWMRLGDVLESKDRAGAIDAYQQASEMNSSDAYPHLLLGQLYEKTKDDKSAEDEYKKALAIDANSGDALAQLSNLYMRENRLNEAETVLREFVAKQPQNENGHLQLGRLLEASKKYDEASDEFEKALQLKPTDGDAMRQLASLQLEMKQYDKAVASLRVVLKNTPNDPEAHYSMGQAMLHGHQFQEAQNEFIEAARLKPTWSEPYGGLAIAASESKNYGLAIKALDERVKYAPDNAGTYFLKATCYDNLGARKEATEFYKKFLEVANGKFPDNEWQARHRLIAIDPETRKKAK